MKANRDRRVDAYIERSAEFAQPILRHLRELIHRACPGIQEDIKWNFPAYVHHGILCGTAAFKAHCSFGFWHQGMTAQLKREGVLDRDSMGSLGRITSLKDLPNDKTMLRCIRAAAELNEAGGSTRTRPKKRKPVAKVPADLTAALRKNKAAAETFKKFSPYNRREYIEWITAAQRPETRLKRLTTALAWLAEGKPRNWKYM